MNTPTTPPRSFNVDRAGSKAASANNTLTPQKLGASTTGAPSADQAPGSAPSAPPAPPVKAPAAGSRPAVRAKPVDPAKLTAEDLLQRLRYFENLDEVRVAYIKTLQGLVSRTGTAVPAHPHVKTFLSAAGNVDPNAPVAYP